MKEQITLIVENLMLYDYLLFGGAFFLFIFLIVLALVARKRLWLSSVMITVAFAIIILAPTLGYKEMRKHLYKQNITLTSEKKLQFSKAVIVEGELQNLSQYDFKSCDITARVYKSSENELKKFLFSIFSFQNVTIREELIFKDTRRKFKIIIEPFEYEGLYSIAIGATCR